MTLLAIITIFSNAFAFDVNSQDYQRPEHWDNAPEVVVCNDAPVTVPQVEKAVKVWKDAGEKIGNVRKQKDSRECTKDYNFSQNNKIIVTKKLRFLKPHSQHGVTVNYKYPDSNIVVHSILEINKDSVSSQPALINTLLSHEIGHALGYKHQKFSKMDIMQEHIDHIK